MDIKINAKNHPNQEKLAEFYNQKLQSKFGVYPFIITMKVDVNMDKERYKVALTAIPQKGNTMYANYTDQSEHTAFTEALEKIKRQVEKYKELHYKSSHKQQKNAKIL